MEKRIRTMSEGDRISNIHESILCHIMSRLPSKEAVRTSILSKEWRCKWKTSIYTINISGLRYTSIDKQRFKTFAENMLLVSPIRNVFFSNGTMSNESRWVETWVSSFLRRNTSIENLTLLFSGKVVSLPHSLLNTTSMRHLVLSLSISYIVPAEIFFPNLISMLLQSVEIRHESSDNDVLKFTLLFTEKIVFCDYKWVNVKSVSVYAPELTTFWYMDPLFSKGNNITNDISIEIVGTKLTPLHCSGLPENLIMSGSKVKYFLLSDLTGVDRLPLTGKSELLVRRLLEGFSSLENLQMLNCWFAAITEPGFPFPMFYHLRELVIYAPRYSGSIIGLLHKTPYLKFLTIKMLKEDFVYCDAVESVPSCISLHLEELVFDYSCDTPVPVTSTQLISHLEEAGFDCLAVEDEIFNLPKFFIKYGVSPRIVHFRNFHYCKIIEGKTKVKFLNVKYSRTTQESEFIMHVLS